MIRSNDQPRLADDYRLGYISASALADIYGVVLDAAGDVDVGATKELRQQRSAEKLRLKSTSEPDSYCRTAVSKHRICRLNESDANRIGAVKGELVEMDSGKAAPLRAWLEVSSEVQSGSVPIDENGLRMLQANANETLEVRRVGAGRPIQ
ncbi:MAG: hypothetical protein AAF709_25875 [Pseudomonadota bacterium]